MEIRWLGEVELTFNPSFYPSLVRMPMTPMTGRPPTIAHSGWATVKLGIDLGEVFSKGPEQGEDRDIFCHFDPVSLSCYHRLRPTGITISFI